MLKTYITVIFDSNTINSNKNSFKTPAFIPINCTTSPHLLHQPPKQKMVNHLLPSVVAVLALFSASAFAEIPWNTYYHVPKSPFGNSLARIPDPPPMVIKGTPPKEPPNPYDKVYRCWGYLGRPEALGWVKLFFINGTLPGVEVCRGVLNVDKDCWPDMFKIWWFTNLKRINHLGHHCRQLIWKEERLPLE